MDLIPLLICVLLEILAGICPGAHAGRIVGGYIPLRHTNKHMVSIQSTSNEHICGGSLINKYWVLTAAHCDIGIQRMLVVAGEYSLMEEEGSEQRLPLQSLIPHPRFNKDTNDYDIMLIKLKTPVFLSNFVSIALVSRQSASLPHGLMCKVSGWGLTSLHNNNMPATILTVQVPIVSNEHCNSSSSFDGQITDTMLCAGFVEGGKDACKGDSGGPLICEGRIYGLVSWGKGCAEANFPGVYTNVARFRTWIDDTIFSYFSRCDNI